MRALLLVVPIVLCGLVPSLAQSLPDPSPGRTVAAKPAKAGPARVMTKASAKTAPRTAPRTPSKDQADDNADSEDDSEDEDPGLSVPLGGGAAAQGRLGRLGPSITLNAVDDVATKRRAFVAQPRPVPDFAVREPPDLRLPRAGAVARRAGTNGLSLGLTFDLPQ